jgi:hypothetical protein
MQLAVKTRIAFRGNMLITESYNALVKQMAGKIIKP